MRRRRRWKQAETQRPEQGKAAGRGDSEEQRSLRGGSRERRSSTSGRSRPCPCGQSSFPSSASHVSTRGHSGVDQRTCSRCCCCCCYGRCVVARGCVAQDPVRQGRDPQRRQVTTEQSEAEGNKEDEGAWQCDRRTVSSRADSPNCAVFVCIRVGACSCSQHQAQAHAHLGDWRSRIHRIPSDRAVRPLRNTGKCHMQEDASWLAGLFTLLYFSASLLFTLQSDEG